MSIGMRLKGLRGKRTQQEIAEQVGISRARYSHYENERSEPDNDVLQKLSLFYGVTTDYLLTGTNQQYLFDINEPEKSSLETINDYEFARRLNELIRKEIIDMNALLSNLNMSEAEFSRHIALGEEITQEQLQIILDSAKGYKDYLLKKKHTAPEEKVNRDVAKRLATFMEELERGEALAFDGEPMSDEAKESLMESMELLFRQTQRINKKFTPKKYREDE